MKRQSKKIWKISWKKKVAIIVIYKDEISKSISLNKLYIDQNLVVGYLAKNPINTLENSNQ